MKGAIEEMKNIRYSDSFAGYQQYLDSLRRSNRGQLQALRQGLQLALTTDLTPKQLEYVELYYFHRMNMPQIAAQAGIQVSTVSRTLARARARLFNRLRFLPTRSDAEAGHPE